MMIEPRMINIVATRRCWAGIILMYVLCKSKEIADILRRRVSGNIKH